MAKKAKTTKGKAVGQRTARPVGFWSTKTLMANLGGIVDPYYPDRTREAVHRLSMGDQYYVTPDATNPDRARQTTVLLKEGESFQIDPGHFGFLLTEESVNMPADVIGFVSIQTDIKFLGLINISGFHVDPGSRDKLIFSVFNAGPNPVHLKRGDLIFRLWVASLDQPDSLPRSVDGYDSIPSKIVNGISGSLLSLQSLSDKLQEADNQLRRHQSQIYWLSLITGSIFATISATVIAGIILLFLQINVQDHLGSNSDKSLYNAPEKNNEAQHSSTNGVREIGSPQAAGNPMTSSQPLEQAAPIQTDMPNREKMTPIAPISENSKPPLQTEPTRKEGLHEEKGPAQDPNARKETP